MIISLELEAQVGVNTDGSNPENPAECLAIYNTDCKDIQFFNGTDWVPVGNVWMLATPDSISGNPCTNAVSVTYSIARCQVGFVIPRPFPWGQRLRAVREPRP